LYYSLVTKNIFVDFEPGFGLTNTDDAILHDIASYVIDDEKFLGLDEKFYLKTGQLVIKESNENKDPTAIYLNIVNNAV
jgi:hypothetical protein